MSTNHKILVLTMSFIGLVALFLLFSLLSHHPLDPSFSQTSTNDTVYNWGGKTGAYFADLFLTVFGFIAYAIPLIVLILIFQGCYYLYRHRGEVFNYFIPAFIIIGFLGFIITACAFFALRVRDGYLQNAGGILGELMGQEFVSLFGYHLAIVISFVFAILCITLILSISWLKTFDWIGRNLSLIFGVIATAVMALYSRFFAKEKEELTSFRYQNDRDNFDRIQLGQTATGRDSQSIPAVKIEPDFTQNRSQPNAVDFTEPDLTPRAEPNSKLDSTAELLGKVQALLSDIMVEKEEKTAATAELNSQSEATDEPLETIIPLAEEVAVEQVHYEINENQPPVLKPEDIFKDSTVPSEINENYYSPIKERQDNSPNGVIDETSIAVNETDSANPNEVQADKVVDLTDIDFGFADLDSPPPLADHQNSLDYVIDSFEPKQSAVSGENLSSNVSEHSQSSINGHNSNITDNITTQFQKESGDISVEQSLTSDEDKYEDDDSGSLIHPLLKKGREQVQKPTTPLPSLELLTAPSKNQVPVDPQLLERQARILEKSLEDFNVKCQVVAYEPGPVITRFEIALAPGIKASKVTNLSQDIARSLSLSSIRVVEVIPGKPYVGIELPNPNRQTVYFKEVLDSPQFKEAKSPLTIALGQDILGHSVVADLAKMPHLLVAGTTGSGKSVGVNAMILSILYKAQPQDVRFIMIDPKMLELSVYRGIPHLLTDVVTDMKDAANALNWCVNEMERRYQLMSALGVRNIAGYNEKIQQADEMNLPIPNPLWLPGQDMNETIPMLEKLPYIVVIVDEFADLIMAVGKKIEELIARLAQKARAAGIHLVLATQRPSVDVITGLIKANIPTRIAFTVSSKIDSRTILDQMGAESLLGMGDMLYSGPNSTLPIRVHGAFVDDNEVHRVVNDWIARKIPTEYVDNITAEEVEQDPLATSDKELDPLFDQVVEFVMEVQNFSISSIQRRFRVGYNRSARIVEQMEEQGIVSPPGNNNLREVRMNKSRMEP